jgi:hypothetical protein
MIYLDSMRQRGIRFAPSEKANMATSGSSLFPPKSLFTASPTRTDARRPCPRFQMTQSPTTSAWTTPMTHTWGLANVQILVFIQKISRLDGGGARWPVSENHAPLRHHHARSRSLCSTWCRPSLGCMSNRVTNEYSCGNKRLCASVRSIASFSSGLNKSCQSASVPFDSFVW